MVLIDAQRHRIQAGTHAILLFVLTYTLPEGDDSNTTLCLLRAAGERSRESMMIDNCSLDLTTPIEEVGDFSLPLYNHLPPVSCHPTETSHECNNLLLLSLHPASPQN